MEARRSHRRAAPVHFPGDLISVEEAFRRAVEQELRRNPGRHAEQHRDFALTRYQEGARAADYLISCYGLESGARILDVGGGNSGFLLPFAERGFECMWTDHQMSIELHDVRRATGIKLGAALADGARLPFRDASFDVVLYVETIEHVDARAVGREIARVLRPNGICYITTPPRFRFLFRGDPHYGIAGLLLLPDSLQRLAFSFLRPHERYEVEHIFWSVFGVSRTLPGLRVREVTSKNWAGPLRRLDWDWIIVRK